MQGTSIWGTVLVNNASLWARWANHEENWRGNFCTTWYFQKCMPILVYIEGIQKSNEGNSQLSKLDFCGSFQEYIQSPWFGSFWNFPRIQGAHVPPLQPLKELGFTRFSCIYCTVRGAQCHREFTLTETIMDQSNVSRSNADFLWNLAKFHWWTQHRLACKA